jgi:hypothetical protein
MRMRHVMIVVRRLPDPTLFFNTSHKGHDLRKTIIKRDACFDLLYFAGNISHSKKN